MRRAVLAAALLAACARGRLVHDGRIDTDALAEVRADLPAIRGLAFTAPVPARALDAQEIAAWLAHDLDETYPPGDLERLAAVYARLGFIPPGARLRPALERLYEGQIAAFYDPRTKELVVGTESLGIGGVGVRLVSLISGRDLVGELLVAHELTHALQDQHWGLPIDSEPIADAHGDRLLARRALLEGDATLAGYAYVQGGTPSSRTIDGIASELRGVGPTLAHDYPDVPALLRDGLAFQYDAGTAFAGWALAAGGWTAVDAAEADPPESSEQVLHPARYFGTRDRPIEIRLDGTAPLEGAGWKRTVEDTLGELGVRILGERLRDDARARRVADGWGGDRLRALARDGTLVVVWMTAWDADADAAEFADAAPAMIPAARVDRRGTHVLVLLGADAGGVDLDGLATRVWGATRFSRAA